MNDMQQAAQIATAAGAGGKAAAGTAAKITLFGLFTGAIACASVVMAATTPDKKRDVFICLMSTLTLSLGGGAIAGIKLGYIDDVVAAVILGNEAHLVAAVMAFILLAFCCGLPAWCAIGGYFVWTDRMKGKSIIEILEEARQLWK